MISLGIDQSLTGTAMMVLHDGRIIHKETVETRLKGYDRLKHIIERIETTVEANRPDVIQMEDYSLGLSGATAIKLCELGGIIKWQLHHKGYREGTDAIPAGEQALLIVSAQSMKKFVLGKGNMEKDTGYLLKVFEKLHERFQNDNEADAYMHAWMASMVVQVMRDKVPVDNLTNQQQEALISKGVKRTPGLSMVKAMKLSAEEKRKLVHL